MVEEMLGTTPDASKAAWLPKDVQLLTVDTFPADVRMRIGSIVAAHSVKMCDMCVYVHHSDLSFFSPQRKECRSLVRQ